MRCPFCSHTETQVSETRESDEGDVVRRRRRCRPQADLSLDEAQETFCLYERLHQPFLLWWGSAEERFFNGLLGKIDGCALGFLGVNV